MALMKDRCDRLREDVLRGSLSRRDVLRRSIALGLGAPAISSLLAACRSGDDPDTDDVTASPTVQQPTETGPVPSGTPGGMDGTTVVDDGETGGTPTAGGIETGPGPEVSTERGGGGMLRLRWWQAPTTLNPHHAQGTRDFDASRLILEPLGDFNDDGSVYPVLAETVPSLENGAIAADGLSVTWTLRQGVTWHDGTPFTSADVKFTYEWITAEGSTATTRRSYDLIAAVETPDDHTVVVRFHQPNPAWFDVFVGNYGRIIPMHLMQEYMGDRGRDAPFNLHPIGTGPYKTEEFRPGDVLLCQINTDYRDAGKPFFDTVELRGSGEAAAAARDVLVAGEADYAWNLQVESSVLEQMEAEGDGVLISFEGTDVERILVNMTNPYLEVDGERAALGEPHPIFSDLEVRQALALACDREAIAAELYGRAGVPTANWLVAPDAFASPNMNWTFDLEAAGALLDSAGWTLVDRRREKDGAQMAIVFQSTINSVRQRTQSIIQQALEQLGILVSLKALQPETFFSSDPEVEDTAAHFYADLEMYTNGPASPYPIAYARENLSRDPDDIAQRSNDWSGANYTRWQNEEYNELYTRAETEFDPQQQAELFVRMNDLVIEHAVQIPLVQRYSISARSADLEGVSPSRWTSELHNVADWRRAT